MKTYRLPVVLTGGAGAASGNFRKSVPHGVIRAIQVNYDGQPGTCDVTLTCVFAGITKTILTLTNSNTDFPLAKVFEAGKDNVGADVAAGKVGELVEPEVAGELIVTSINQEGTGKGFDLELTRHVAESVSIPVIACGGAGKLQHMSEVIVQGSADAVSVASVLHYNAARRFSTMDGQYMDEGNTEYLRSQRRFSLIEDATLQDIKQALSDTGVECRREEAASIHGG